MSQSKVGAATMHALVFFAQHNPGALTCLLELAEEENGLDKTIPLLNLAELNGVKLYLLWSDIFRKDTAKLSRLVHSTSWERLHRISNLCGDEPSRSSTQAVKDYLDTIEGLEVPDKKRRFST